jgi:hypothetical protein
MLFVYPFAAMLGVRKETLVNEGKDLGNKKNCQGLEMGHAFNQFLLPGEFWGTDIYTEAQWATQNNTIAICNPVELVSASDG